MNAQASLPSRAVGRAVNRALRGEDALRERLARHAGAVFELRSGPATAVFAISPEGTLDEPAPGHAAELTLDVAPHDLPRLMHDPGRFERHVRIEGDGELAATLRDMAVTWPWFVERMLATAFGAVAGQRLADAGRALLGWPAVVLDRLSEQVGSYVRDESAIGVARADAASFADDLGALEARVAALAARIDALAAPAGATAGR